METKMPRTGRPPLPPGQKLTKRELHLRYMEKLYADPERAARFRAKKCAQQAARLSDPVKRLERNDRDRDRNAESQRRAHRDPLRWPLRAVNRLRYIAKSENIPFNIDATDIPIPDVCPVLGTPFVFGEGYRNDLGPSVDKIRPELGYVKGNVRVISLRANRLKHDLTGPDDLRKVLADLESRERKEPPP